MQLIYRFEAEMWTNRQTNRQTDPTTVTLAAHAHRVTNPMEIFVPKLKIMVHPFC